MLSVLPLSFTAALLSFCMPGGSVSSASDSTEGGWQALAGLWHRSAQEAPTQKPAPAKLVTAEPNPLLPGQTITFRTPADAARVVASGGGFGHNTDVTGRSPLTDKPPQTTTYTFTIWLREQKGGKSASDPTAQTPRKETVITHVYEGSLPTLATYHDPRHWRVDCVAGWNRYVTPEADPANNALLFFQPQEDTPERIAVAIVPVGKMSAEELMHKVLLDAPTQYDVLQNVQQKPTTHAGVPAAWMTFKGLDRALPGVATLSMVLAFVRDGRGYVISGRTSESRYAEREKILRCLVRSFAFEPATKGAAIGTGSKESSRERSRRRRG